MSTEASELPRIIAAKTLGPTISKR